MVHNYHHHNQLCFTFLVPTPGVWHDMSCLHCFYPLPYVTLHRKTYTNDFPFLNRIPFTSICKPFEKICTRSNSIRHPFSKKIHSFERLGHLFAGNTGSFEWLDHPFAGNANLFKQLGHTLNSLIKCQDPS